MAVRGDTVAWYVHSTDLQRFAEVDCANSVYADSEGNLWFFNTIDRPGCAALIRYDGEVPQEFTPESGLPRGFVSAIAEDQQGRVWIGVRKTLQSLSETSSEEGYVSVYENGLWRTMTEKGSPKTNIHSIFEDSQSNMWFGTDAGLYRYDGQEWSRLTSLGQFSGYLGHITEDPRGNLWVGTSQGLIRYNVRNHKLDTFTSLNSGLVVDQVVELLVDHDGVMWVVTSEYRTVGRAPWLAVSLALLACFGTPAMLYRRYNKLPSTKAARLAREVEHQPEQLYAVYYDLMASTPDSGAVLGCQDAFGRFEWAPLPAALAGLAQGTDNPVAALERLRQPWKVRPSSKIETGCGCCTASCLRQPKLIAQTRSPVLKWLLIPRRKA